VFSQFSKPVLFLFFNPYGRLISKEIENEFWRIGSDFLHDILAHRKSKDYFSGNEFLLDFVQKVKTFFSFLAQNENASAIMRLKRLSGPRESTSITLETWRACTFCYLSFFKMKTELVLEKTGKLSMVYV
jgi:hypothetical protein